MTRRARKLVIGAAVIAVALGALVVTGIRQSVVYFVTPSELLAAPQPAGKAYRVGGMVVPGSLKKDVTTLRQDFLLSDGKATVPVRFKGVPPDLFAEGRGAVVEGTLAADGTFQASTIMAKHSEEYKAPHEGQAGYQELLRTFRGTDSSAPTTKPGS